MDNISIIYFNNLLKLLVNTLNKNDEKHKSFIKIKKGVLKSEPFNLRMAGSNMNNTIRLFENNLILEKIEGVNKNIVFDFLKMYDPIKNYGVIIKVNGKIINPLHPFNALKEATFINNYKENDFIFDIYVYKYKHNSFSKNIDVVEKYKNNIRENLHNYFKNKSDCFSEVSYKLITEDSYDMENHLKSINDKLLSNHIKDIWYKSLITNYIATENDYIRFDRKGDINLNDDEELVIPVSLATLYISYPYYGLLGITKNSEGCFTPGVCGRNISNNFLSGNIGVHLDSFASIYYQDEYSFNTIGYENYNLVDIYKGDDSFSSLLENCVDNADDAENYTMEETYTRDEVLENNEYFNMVLNNDLIYSTKVCLGSNAKNISESDCLSNMNMDSMFNSFTLSDHWIEEAIASQEIAKEIISSFLEIYKSNNIKNKEEKKGE